MGNLPGFGQNNSSSCRTCALALDFTKGSFLPSFHSLQCTSMYFAFLHTPVGHSQREGPGPRLQRLRHATADEHFRCDCLTSRNLLTPHCFLQGMWEKGNDSCSGHPISAASQLLPWLSHTHVTGMCSQMGSPAL